MGQLGLEWVFSDYPSEGLVQFVVQVCLEKTTVLPFSPTRHARINHRQDASLYLKMLYPDGLGIRLWIRRVLVRAQEGQCPR